MPPSVAIITHSDFLDHLTGYRHPERPERITSILTALHDAGLMRPENTIYPVPADEEEIARCHSWEYLRLVEKECLQAKAKSIDDGSYALSTGDVQICPDSFRVAKLAVGGALAAVDAVFEGTFRRSFAVVRPPGHHARSSQGMGFCLFNNAAIAARYAQAKYGVKRVLIVDWDVHHGNGTQDIFYEDASVLYFSTHRANFYPGTGTEDQRGSGEGSGTCVNVPIQAKGRPRNEIIHAFAVTLPKIVEDFYPELILISAGFDAHKLDPIGGFDLESEDYATLTRLVVEQANICSEGRVVSLLEGGYNLQALGESAVQHVNALIGPG